eukprot:265731-Lingulodinium_polyedra.AAC.1
MPRARSFSHLPQTTRAASGSGGGMASSSSIHASEVASKSAGVVSTGRSQLRKTRDNGIGPTTSDPRRSVCTSSHLANE